MKNALRVVAQGLRHSAALSRRPLHRFARCERIVSGPRRAFSPIASYTTRRAYSAVAAPVSGLPSQNASHSQQIDEHAIAKAKRLPSYCPGCGAPSQIVSPEDAGFYTLTRGAIKAHLREDVNEESETYASVLQDASPSTLSQLGLSSPSSPSSTASNPICDRCHNLLHHHAGTPIYHPSMDSIKRIIEESPFKDNHIYHVLDAADFPMSLIPSLQSDLRLPRLRTQNRRSKSMKYIRGRTAEVSFIITRSDLLAPKKEQVDSMMAYLREVLRDALGRSGKNVRLGNMRCVSAKRGWWTREVKEDVWKRGGAGWMVGKVNVGKSNLFEVVFPKGRGEAVDLEKRRAEARLRGLDGRQALTDVKNGDLNANSEQRRPHAFKGDAVRDDMAVRSSFLDEGSSDVTNDGNAEMDTASTNQVISDDSVVDESALPDDEDEPYDESDLSLLPPAQAETAFPVMPIASSLPGTTASPIRIPFGSGKGELIDLPGIARSDLSDYVKLDHQADLVMKNRIVPEQITIKPGQSLLLGGGLIRITPDLPHTGPNANLVILSHSFIPITSHVTSTDKAIGIQTGERQSGVESILDHSKIQSPSSTDDVNRQSDDVESSPGTEPLPRSESSIKSAGTFKLKWDVTRKRAGPLTDPTAVKLKADNLPFIVWSADILIEGVGWIELVAQTRRPRGYTSQPSATLRVHRPDIESDLAREEEDPFASRFNSPSGQSQGRSRRGETGMDKGHFEDIIPAVEVFTPLGKFVGVRPPMNASLIGGKKKVPVSQRKSRPRQSMRSVKASLKGRQS